MNARVDTLLDALQRCAGKVERLQRASADTGRGVCTRHDLFAAAVHVLSQRLRTLATLQSLSLQCAPSRAHPCPHPDTNRVCI